MTGALERLYIKYPGNPPEYLWEYPEAEQARWILELSPSPLPVSRELRVEENLLIIAGQIQTFLDRVGVPRMVGMFKDAVKHYLLTTPIRDLREETLSHLYEMVDLSFVSVEKNGGSEFTCVIPNLHAALQDGVETSEYVDVDDLMTRNNALLREARDHVMSGWE